jgi:hypothetical protein
MTESSEAADAYRGMEPFNLQRHSEYLRERLVQIGALTDGDTTHPRYPEMFDVPLDQGLAQVATVVLSALAGMGYEPAQLNALTVGVTSDDGLPASYRSYADRTGLILVSDSLVILSNAYCEYMGRAMADTTSGGLIRMLGRLLLTRWTGTIGEDPRLLAGILRYHNVCRRVYGIAAVLNFARGHELAPAAQELMLEFGLRFVVGHEAAHHVLGHRSSSQLLPPTAPDSPDSASENREADADTLALFAAAAAYEQDTAEMTGNLKQRWRQEVAEFHGLLGAIITMLALQTLEQALMIRRGQTHLPAGERMRLLAEHILGQARQDKLEDQLGRSDVRMTMRFEKDRGTLGVYIQNLITATELASSFAEGGTTFDWEAFASSPLIQRPSIGHLEQVAAFDRLICAQEATLIDEIGTRLDADGLRLVLAGDTKNGLLTWSVPEYRVEAMHDPAQALAFYTIVEAIQETIPSGDDSRRVCVAAATLIARRMLKVSSHTAAAA